MKKYIIYLFFFIPLLNIAQTVVKTTPFSLASPFIEPDGRSDYLKIPGTNDFITLSKTKGNQKGVSEFALERYTKDLTKSWSIPLTADQSEEFKKLYFNGKDVVLLSVVHNEKEKKTSLYLYAYDPASGKQNSKRELETYLVKDYENHPHKGKVKESFLDVVCEHVDPDFVTPFEYKHHLNFSPDGQKFVSYIYNYGEKNLTTTATVYDKLGNKLTSGTVAIDNDFTNYGVHVNNAGETFLVNANNFGKVNIIKYNFSDNSFDLLELPGSNYQKDDFQVRFLSDQVLLTANTEVSQGKVLGVLLTKFDFKNRKVVDQLHLFSDTQKQKILSSRKADKTLKGEEDWKDYDINDFIVLPDNSVILSLEKRSLYADGYPHIGREVFDKSHQKQIDAHIKAEGIIIMAFNPDGTLKWDNFIAKNQVFPAMDGLNTISFITNLVNNEIRILYAESEHMDASFNHLRLVILDSNTGAIKKNNLLPNEEKLSLVKDFTVWYDDSMILVGKKGLMGKKSSIIRYKL